MSVDLVISSFSSNVILITILFSEFFPVELILFNSLVLWEDIHLALS